MKLRRLCALLLSFAMLLSLLSGCGGKESEEGGRGDVISEEQGSDPGDGRGDAISEEQGSDPGDTLDEPEVNFEDFFGCWEYWDYDIWLYVYGDGTYEMYNENGDCTAGSYTPEGTEIVLDSGERFALDGEGGLIDEDGDTLFPTELPDLMRTATLCFRLSCLTLHLWHTLRKAAIALIWRWTREGSPWKTLSTIPTRAAAATPPPMANGH